MTHDQGLSGNSRSPLCSSSQALVALALLLSFAALAAATAPRAAAVTDAEELTRFGSEGEAAGQLSGPAGVATDPLTGHVYVADAGNNRIDEFTPWGNFVKAFGWDVAPAAVNEQQEVRVRAAGGQFKLSFEGETTADLAFDAGAAEVEAALDSLASIGGAGANISVSSVTGTSDGKTPSVYVLTFEGSLAGADLPELTTENGATPLSGGVPSTSLEARTRADGTAGGGGLESCTGESGCRKGLEGDGMGQFRREAGLAIDAAGDVYVREIASNGNARVQKFDSAGRFLLMAGGEVNKTKSAEAGSSEAERNRCTEAQAKGGDECGAGSIGTGQGQFAAGYSDGIAIGSGGHLFVADVGRVQRFNLEGEYEASIPTVTAGEAVRQLAFDPLSGDLYVTFEGEAKVHRVSSASGVEISTLQAGEPLTTDPAGHLFAHGSFFGGNENEVLEFDPSGQQISSCCEAEPLPPPYVVGSLFRISAMGSNTIGDLYVAYYSPSINSFIRAFGPGPTSFEAAPRVAPTITAQFASSVDRDGATVAAEINPHFWSDTRFYVQYGTGRCAEGGCEATKPLPPGALLGSKTVAAPLKSPSIVLEGLEPGTTYHYRFIAQSSAGGPVRGIGGEVGADGEESTFTTYPALAPAKADCPNQAFRGGLSAPLPDCRAFEMVSPVDKNGGDIKALIDPPEYDNALDQSSTDGGRFTYSSYRAFAGAKAAPYTVQYMAERRDGVGWFSEAVSPPQGFAANFSPLGALENPYKAFSADLCSGWLVVAAEPPLAPEATAGYSDLYRRDGCGEEVGYEALVGVEPTVEAGFFNLELQGASADGKTAILRVKDSLTPDATEGVWQTYYAKSGQLNLVCILPSGVPSAANCSAGTGWDSGPIGGIGPAELHRLASVKHAISVDGSRVYWTNSGIGDGRGSGPGKIYLRINPDREQSAVSGEECTEPERACTIAVSETVSGKASRFLGATPDGSRALFEVTEGTQEGNLYRFDLESGASTLIAKKAGLLDGPNRRFSSFVGASEDLSRIYFVSEEELPGTVGASAGKANLYLDEDGESAFVATLSKVDAGGVPRFSSNTNPRPIFHLAKVTPDGRQVLFSSTESLTGYDNTDQASGRADAELYLYEAGAARPVCVSCNPSGARPHGRILGAGNSEGDFPTAGSIPAAQYMFHPSRALSADGRRLFFDSYDALLPRDTNAKEDVYEWEATSGAQECAEKGAELYVPSSAGCLSLISSGESPSDSEFLDATPSGDDAFFTTNAGLLPQDPGLVDVYDARVEGGFAQPSATAACEGEACQGPLAPPNDPTPASAGFRGPGNVKKAAKARCAKGKARRRGRCVAKRHKHVKKQQHRANQNRRQSR